MSGGSHGLSVVTDVVRAAVPDGNDVLATDVTTVTVGGDFDSTQVDTFEHAVQSLPDDEAELTIDISGCTIVDSAALGALVRLKLRLDEQGRSLRMIADRPFQRQILESTGLAEFLGLDPPTGSTSD